MSGGVTRWERPHVANSNPTDTANTSFWTKGTFCLRCRKATVLTKKSRVRAQQGRDRPSLTRSGYMLKAANTPNHKEVNGCQCARRERGRAANRMDFSCTWNEKRKNASDEFPKAKINVYGVGFLSSTQDEGRRAAAVVSKVSFISEPCDSRLRSLMRAEMEHHMLATLSSYSPLAKGNCLWRTWRTVSMSPRKGSQRTTNVANTEVPSKATFSKGDRLRRAFPKRKQKKGTEWYSSICLKLSARLKATDPRRSKSEVTAAIPHRASPKLAQLY